jgi:hypothetical protein
MTPPERLFAELSRGKYDAAILANSVYAPPVAILML